MEEQSKWIEIENIETIFISREREGEGFKDLVESIEKVGLISPIAVQKKETKYELIKGEGRLKAHKVLGIKKIEAYVYGGDVSNKEKIKDWLIENIVRQPLSSFDKARQIHYAFKKAKENIDIVAKDFGIKRDRVRKAISFIENATHNVLEKVKTGAIDMTSAKKIVASVRYPETQNALAQLLTEEDFDDKSEEVLRERAKILETKMRKVSIMTLRRDAMGLKESVQTKKEDLVIYQSTWDFGTNAINQLENDRQFVKLSKKNGLELFKGGTKK